MSVSIHTIQSNPAVQTDQRMTSQSRVYSRVMSDHSYISITRELVITRWVGGAFTYYITMKIEK